MGFIVIGIVRIDADRVDTTVQCDGRPVVYRFTRTRWSPGQTPIDVINSEPDYALEFGESWWETRALTRLVSRVLDGAEIALPFDLSGTPLWRRDAPLLRSVLRRQGMAMSSALTAPVAPFLVEALIVDHPTEPRFATTADLIAWQVDVRAAFETGQRNLERFRVGDLLAAARESDSAATTFHFTNTGTYQNSLLLIPGWLDGFITPTGIRPLVGVPDHSTLLVVMGAGPDGIPAFLKQLEAGYQQSAQALSPVLYTLGESGRLQPYSVPDDHPTWEAHHHAASLLAADTYVAQERVLGQSSPWPAHGRVAQIMVIESASTAFTLAAWSDGEPTLLPRVDFVVLMPGPVPLELHGKKDLAGGLMVQWGELADCVELTPVPGYEPERYLVNSHPGESVRLRLREHGTVVYSRE